MLYKQRTTNKGVRRIGAPSNPAKESDEEARLKEGLWLAYNNSSREVRKT